MQGGEEDMEERKPSKAVVSGDARLSLTQGELWSISYRICPALRQGNRAGNPAGSQLRDITPMSFQARPQPRPRKRTRRALCGTPGASAAVLHPRLLS